ncbi:hypothetical protein [Daejeonella sp.]|uniref:hypothetical protein n=1 Tax=Daejeonella sp. TaxID=2805397 RepID=UPI003983B228
MKKCLITLSLITVMSFMARAQNFSATINSVVNSTVSGTPTLAAFTTDAEIEAGLVTAPVTFAVKSNRLWKLMTSISNVVGTAIGGGPATITAPLQPLNISWGVINGASGTVTGWNPFANATPTTTTAVEAKTGSRGAPAVSGNTFTLQYKVIPGFDVDPGTYAVTVVNTISAQ